MNTPMQHANQAAWRQQRAELTRGLPLGLRCGAGPAQLDLELGLCSRLLHILRHLLIKLLLLLLLLLLLPANAAARPTGGRLIGHPR